MPQARWLRILRGEESLPQYAGRDIKSVEVVVEVERRVIRRVIRVLPTRITVGSDGRVDMRRTINQAMESVRSAIFEPMTVEKAIRDLEIDANRFWVLAESHWRRLSELLGVPRDDVRAALYREPEDR